MPRPDPQPPGALRRAPWLPVPLRSLHSASLFLLHLLLITVGGNWSSISAHSCSPGCRGYRRAGGSWVSRQPHCCRWTQRQTCEACARERGCHQETGSALTERMAALGSRSRDSRSIFLQSQLSPFKCEGLCSHGQCSGTAPGSNPLARRGGWPPSRGQEL